MHESLRNISSNSKRFGLTCTTINDNTLILRGERIQLDEWLAIYDEEEDEIILKHMNKSRKITYHTQNTVKSFNWVWILEKIVAHDIRVTEVRYSLPPIFDEI